MVIPGKVIHRYLPVITRPFFRLPGNPGPIEPGSDHRIGVNSRREGAVGHHEFRYATSDVQTATPLLLLSGRAFLRRTFPSVFREQGESCYHRFFFFNGFTPPSSFLLDNKGSVIRSLAL